MMNKYNFFLRITGFMIGFVVKGHIYYIKFGFSKISKKQKQQKLLYFFFFIFKCN